MRRLTAEEVLTRNPQIDLKRVEAFETFYREAAASGIDVEPHYRVSPALGIVVKGSGQQLAGEDSRNRVT
jgi:hypothetical protein